MSFRKALCLALIPITLIPILILGVFSVYLSIKNVDTLGKEALEVFAETSGISLENYIEAQNREMLLMTKNKRILDCILTDFDDDDHLSHDVCTLAQEALKEWVDADPDYVSAYLLNEQGIVTMCYDGLHIGNDLSGLATFKAAISKIDNTSKDSMSFVLDIENEVIHRSCIVESNGHKGVLILETSLRFYDKLVENISYGKTGASYLIDEQGTIICHSESGMRREILSFTSVGSLMSEYMAGNIPQNGVDTYMYQGIERLMGYYIIENLGWTFVTRQYISEINEPVTSLVTIFVTVFILVIVCSAFACVILIRTFTKPIQSLRNVFQKAASENEYIICEVIGNNEFSELAVGYNIMISQLTLKDEELRQNYLLLETEQKKTEHLAQQLSANLERQTTTLYTIYSSIPDLVFCKDTSGIYTSCNPSFERLAGRTESEILGKRDNEIFDIDQEMTMHFIETDKKVLNSLKPTVTEEWVTYPDGANKLLETIKTPLIQNGKLTGIMGISRDITRHKEAEEGAQVASKAKSAFLAHMSHEIRTPLNAIIGMSDIAKNSIFNPNKALSSINQVITSSRHLLNILNDVLDMSKIESGKLELNNKPFCHSDSCHEVLGIISQQCAAKNINFVTLCDTVENVTIIGDKLRLNQVLINLLGNAVKFTDVSGKIEFLISILEETETNIYLRYSIYDSGIGMTDEQIAKLFTPFEQGDSSISSRFGGTGLGLSISQSIVKAMGGKIEVESTLNVGTKFYFDILFEKGDSIAEVSSETLDYLNLENKRILLVEDIEINRIIIDEVLSSTKVEIDEAEDGQQGVDMFERSPVGYYDLIFMDVHMPVLDGYGATMKIRTLNREDSGSIPIIAMTANAYKEDIDKSLASGMNDHLTKPIDEPAILLILKKFLTV